ncbi:hypothetical protein [Vibrio cionasavignyae]|uniref:hypothetical protein n=1 Tax=Vibrio cionasavignyae TaxID=2910252 RepID=UPI003D1318D5
MLGSLTSLTGGGGFTGGASGPATSGNNTNAGQSVTGINMGGGVNPWLIGGVMIVVVFLVMRKK